MRAGIVQDGGTIVIQSMLRVAALLMNLALGAVTVVQAQPTKNLLPEPGGPFAIGRITYYWTDSSRAAFLNPDAQQPRELAVDVWYPAAPELRGSRAPYLPDLPQLRRVLGDSVLRRRFGAVYAAIEAGRLWAHAVEGGPARCPPGGCALLLFSHGGGVDRSLYTAQYESMASHGYVVAAVAHTFDAPLVMVADGRVVRATATPQDTARDDSTLPRWRQGLARESRSQEHVRRVNEVRALDLRFVLDQLTRHATDSRLGAPFRHQVDLRRVGALGHSAGGMTAALTCQTDPRITACLNQDGVMHNLPFQRDTDGGTMRQAFMYMGRPYDPPRLSDAQLASMEMSRAEADSLFRAIPAGQDSLLAALPAGGYRVSLCGPGVTHMSFSDEPLILALPDSASTANALAALATVVRYTRAFFDMALRGSTGTLLQTDAPSDTTDVQIERFGSTTAARSGTLTARPPNEALHRSVACGARR